MSEPNEMVERVARAIYEKNHLDKWPGDLSELHREVFIRCAEAAIAAMREPTEAMLTAARVGIIPDDEKDSGLATFAEAMWGWTMGEFWRAMIDAALKE